MIMLLQLETSTKNCSVSISKNGQTLMSKELASDKYLHAEKLHAFVQEVIQEAQISFKDLSAVVVSKGPGSYTGLRIGVSAAKGYCVALDIPLIVINTLEVMVQAVDVNDGYLIPMLDARRMEVYTAVFDANKNVVQATQAKVIDALSFNDLDLPCYIFGEGAQKTKEILNSKNFIFLEEPLYPSAKYMSELAHKKYTAKAFEDVAYFEPFYLKEFLITTKS